MEDRYHQQAEEAGVFVVSACGFDAIPQDVGVRFTEDNFSGMHLRILYVCTYMCTYLVTI